jgi:carbon-monoxide dehydrogenase large subunit
VGAEEEKEGTKIPLTRDPLAPKSERPSEEPQPAPRGKTRKQMGIGVSSFTEIVGAGPIKNCDILGLGMFDSCEIRVHPTGSVIARLRTISQGQGHATTFAQILASELGIPAEKITIEEGDTDTAPYGLGTYGSDSTRSPVSPPRWPAARSAPRRR